MKKNKVLLACSIAAVAVAGGTWTYRASRSTSGQAQAATAKYYCPMHPTYTSDKPGDCPICNMKLVPMETTLTAKEPDSEASAAKPKDCVLHKCKMANCVMELPHKAGQRVFCPVCGEPVSEADPPKKGKPLYYRDPMHPEATSPTPKKDEMGMDYIPVYAEETAGPSPSVEGQGAVVISEERRQMIGMKSEAIERRELNTVVRASGKVAYDPELYNVLTEYREAVIARGKVSGSPYPDVIERAEALVRASALRLRQMGLSDAQIKASASEQSPTSLLVGGGDSVWVYAQVYEYQSSLVKPGQRAELTATAFPGKTFIGTVKSVDPILSPETRTLRARIEVPNPGDALKLEMYVNVAIRVHLGRRLALPESALIDTGERKLAFVDLGEGRIEPRELRVGQEADGYYELLSGISDGEKVVTSANFLVDAESRLKAAISQPSKGSGRKQGQTQPAPARAGHRH